MTRTTITWLPTAFAKWGVPYELEAGWKTRGRPTGQFAPIGVTFHHTGTRASTANPHPSLRVVTAGRPDLAGPLCHVTIGYDGKARVIAAGRANHAGVARKSGPIPAGDGNSVLVGFEIDYDGTQHMSAVQYRTAVLAACAVLDHLGHSADFTRTHAETSVTGKWDAGQDGKPIPGATIRAAVGAQLKAGPPGSKPKPTKGTDVHTDSSSSWTGKRNLTPATWTTVAVNKDANPSVIVGAKDFDVDWGVTLNVKPGAAVQIQPVTVVPDGKTYKVARSFGVVEFTGTAGATFCTGHLTGAQAANERLRLRVATYDDPQGGAVTHVYTRTRVWS